MIQKLIINRRGLLLLLFLTSLHSLAQSAIDCRFTPNPENCQNYCVFLEISSQDGPVYIGSSSMRFSYDDSVIRFSGTSMDGVTIGTYESINFDFNDGTDPSNLPSNECTFIPSGLENPISPYTEHSFDGGTPGDFLNTWVLSVPTLFGAPAACPSVAEWVPVSEICFEVLNPNGDPDFRFTGTQNGPVQDLTGTNFNNDTDPPIKYQNGTFEDLNMPFVALCGDNVEIWGCTDPNYCNYFEYANVDDGSCSNGDPGTGNTNICEGDTEIWNEATCSYDIDEVRVLGCMNPIAQNYNPAANCSGNCTIVGECTDEEACNYDPVATVDTDDCTFTGDLCGDNLVLDDNCECVTLIEGCTDENACNYDPEATYNDNNCFSMGDFCGGNNVVDNNCECVPIITGCTNESACNYNPDANTNAGCLYLDCEGVCGGNATQGSSCEEGYVYNNVCECVEEEDCGQCGQDGPTNPPNDNENNHCQSIIIVAQSQIDDFEELYGCDTIFGDLILEGPDVMNMYQSGLTQIKVITGDLIIRNTNIGGTNFASLKYIGGTYWVRVNPHLEDMHGFNLDYVGAIKIEHNPNLETFNRVFENPGGHIPGSVYIAFNRYLEPDLGNLESIGGNLNLRDCLGIVTLGHSFEDLKHIQGGLIIRGMERLDDISSLDRLESPLSFLHIFDNDQLADCCVLNCAVEDMVVEGGEILIGDNLPGCSSLEEIINNCGPCVVATSCEESLVFTSQNDIDNFLQNGCGIVNGDVFISGDDIVNLNGLRNIHTIQGSLKIWDNPLLTNLLDLENLTSIQDSLWIRINPSLTGTYGLHQLQYIHSIRIEYNQSLENAFGVGWSYNWSLPGDLYIAFNQSLSSVNLNAFDNVDGKLTIRDCPCNNLIGNDFPNIGDGLLIRGTTQLEELDNLAHNNILNFLHIYDNDALSDCCHLADWEDHVSSNNIIINDNLSGCNSTEDIEDNCPSP